MQQNLENNRLIKFRVFNTWDKQMHYTDINTMMSLNADGSVNSFNGLRDNVVMQFTGIIGNVDEPIYEGDVVKGFYYQKGVKHRFIGVVKYTTNAFKVCGINQYYGAHQELNGIYEVIGNVYETPDFLQHA